MTNHWLPKLHAILAGILVTVGFAMVWNPIPVPWVLAIGVGFIVLLMWLGPTARHTWAWACLFLGLESLSWPAVQMITLRMSGVATPSQEQAQELVGNAFLGIFFATFWLTFAYGLFRWIRRSETGRLQPKP